MVNDASYKKGDGHGGSSGSGGVASGRSKEPAARLISCIGKTGRTRSTSHR